MKETEYYKSGKQLNNIQKAAELAKTANKKSRIDRIENYKLDPKLCKVCSMPIDYNKQVNSFCSKNCSAGYNNRRRIVSEEHKTKTSGAMKDFYKRNEHTALQHAQRFKFSGVYKEFEIICKICDKHQIVRYKKKLNKTCGNKDCKIAASITNRSYVNGKKKFEKYFCKEINDWLNLESSWEVNLAEWLDEKSIRWIRPKFIKWLDFEGVTRRYFPDFFLIEYDVYIDPKNPYCMVIQKTKMDTIVKDGVPIIYGDLQVVKDKIEDLIRG